MFHLFQSKKQSAPAAAHAGFLSARRLLPAVLILLMLCSVFAFAEETHTHADSGWTALTSSDSTLTTGSYFLSDETVTCGTLTVSGTVDLWLNGHTLEVSQIKLNTNAVLNICDCDHTGGTIHAGSSAASYTVVYNGAATLNLYGGTIWSEKSTAVRIDKANAKFNMYGGSVKVTAAGADAVLLFATGAEAVIAGGTVEASSVSRSAVLNNEGTLRLQNDAVLKGGKGDKGTLYIKNKGLAILEGGSIIRGTGPALTCSEGTTLTVAELLPEGIGLFADADADTQIELLSGANSLTGVAAVYICEIPSQYTISLYLNSELFSSTRVRQGRSFDLPAYLRGTDQQIYRVNTYSTNTDTYHPGTAITVEGDMDLTVGIITHTCDDGLFVTPIDSTYITDYLSAGDTVSSGTYYLTEDCDLNSRVLLIDGNVCLCLNGHQLTVSQIKLQKDAQLTVCDCGGSGRISSSAVFSSEGMIQSGGTGATFTLKGGTIDASATYGVRFNHADCALNMTGGVIKASASTFSALCMTVASDTASISGGSIIAEGACSYAANVTNGTLTLSGDGRIIAQESNGTCNTTAALWFRNTAKVIINGGTITTPKNNAIQLDSADNQLIITGGTITAANQALYIKAAADIQLSGGTFIATAAGGKPIMIVSTVDKTLGDLLVTGHDYYLDTEADTRVSALASAKSISETPVYVLETPPQYTINLYMNGSLFSTASVRQGKTFDLPAYLRGTDLLLYRAESYSDGTVAYQPGDTITVTADMELTVSVSGHTCDDTLYTTPVDSAYIAAYMASGTTLEAGAYYLTEDCDLTGSELLIDGNVRLCLNGHQLTVKQVKLQAGAHFTVDDCSETGSGMIYSAADLGTNGLIQTAGTNAAFTLKGGTISAAAGYGVRFDKTGCTLNMTGGVIKASAVGKSALCLAAASDTANISGGSIIAEGKAQNAVNLANGTLTLSGNGCILAQTADGTCSATAVLWVRNAGTAIINGGTISTPKNNAIHVEVTTGQLIVTDGTVTAANQALYVKAASGVQLSGGTFTATAANSKPLVIDSSVTATIGSLLSSGCAYYQDTDADQPVTYSAEDQFIAYPATVYVRTIPASYTLTFTDAQGNLMNQSSVRKDRDYRLTLYHEDASGVLQTVDHYTFGTDTLAPGTMITLNRDETIAVSFIPAHVCSEGTFGAVINTAIAAAYTDIDFTMNTGAYYLGSDVELHGSIQVTGNVSLCLNGHSVKVNQIKLVAGATLTFCDCSVNHDGIFESTETDPASPAIDATAANTHLIIRSGRIVADGMGISVSGGSTFEMSGGRLVVNGEQECCLKIAGGASVTLANCTLEGRAARLVNIGNGTLTINAGAELIGNSRSVITTSGTNESPYIPVHLNDANAVLIMNGGEIVTALDDAVYAKKYKEIQIRGGRIVGGYDGFTSGRSALYIANNSGGICTVSGGTITNQSYKSDGTPRGHGITNYGQLIITGSAVIEGSQYALWNKSQATVTTDVSVESPDRLVGGEAAVMHDKGTITIAGGVLIGSKYALCINAAVNNAADSVGTVILSGGRYTCTSSSGSPVSGLQDVDDFLNANYAGGTLGYYLQAEGTEHFDEAANGYLNNKHKLNPAVSMTAYVRTQDEKPCPHDEWAWQSSEGQPDTLGICTQCNAILVQYVGCSMTIDKDLSMTFMIRLYDDQDRLLDNNWSMRLNRDSSTGTGLEDTTDYNVTLTPNETVRTGDTLTFTYHGINSQCMTTPIHASLIYTEESWRKTASEDGKRAAVSDKALPLPDRTVREYCVRLYAQGTTDSTVALIANLLKYGAASQVYNNWYTDKLATGGDAAVLIGNAITASAPSVTTGITPYIDGYSIGMTLRLGYQTELAFVVTGAAGPATLKILCGSQELKSVSVSAGDRIYYAVAPMNYDVLFTAQLYTAEGELAYQRTYSVDTYIQRYWSNTSAAGTLLREMYHFSRATMAFVQKDTGEFVSIASVDLTHPAVSAGAPSEGSLSLPAALRVISESAFEDADSLNEVVIGEKVTRIESRAFAGSSVKLVIFPQNSALEYIAPDAFADTEGVQFIIGGSDTARNYLGTNGITEYGATPDQGGLYLPAITLPYVPF